MNVNILWTGGLDSTFRVIELMTVLPDGYTIQPYYIFDEHRKSSSYEIRAMKEITELANSKANNSVIIKPLIITKKSEIPMASDISVAYERLRHKYNLGGQYDWLARFAESSKINIELGLEYSLRSKAYNTIKSEGNIKLITPSDGYTVYCIDKSCSSDDLLKVFGRFMLSPKLFNITKEKEVEILRELGYNDVIHKTWFCHRPILGYPCGHCNPCKDALNEGMRWRVPRVGRLLGTLRLPLDYASKAISKLTSLIIK